MYKFSRQTVCRTQTEINRSGGTVVKNTDGTVDVFYRGISDFQLNQKACCEKLGFKFDINTQRCYWGEISNEVPCSDCTTKVVYNPRDNDGVLFNVNDGETCSLDLSLDYILNFDCDVFTKTCSNDSSSQEITNINNTISGLQTQINTKSTECQVLTTKLNDAKTLFDNLCYVIKGTKATITRGGLDPNVSIVNDWTSPWQINTLDGILNTTTPNDGTTQDGTIRNTPVVPSISNIITTTTIPDDTTRNVPVVPSIYDINLNANDIIPTYYVDDNQANDYRVVDTPVFTNNFNNIIPLGTAYSTLNFTSSNGYTNNTATNININNTPPPPFAWMWKSTYDDVNDNTSIPTNTTTYGPVSYCLTEKGLNLWAEVLGRVKYESYVGSFGCDETTYTQTDFDNLLANINTELRKNSVLSMTDFVTETTQSPCDKKTANTNLATLTAQSEKCKTELITLNNELNNANNTLSTTISTTTNSNDAISNLENLQVHLNLEVEQADNSYKSIYEEPIFNIGKNNFLNYILNESPDTGILISGATSGVILKSPFDSGLEERNNTCDTGRDDFLKILYLKQYKDNYPDPTTPEAQLELNKKMNGWYNSSWLYYKKTIDETIVSQIKNKKIKISLRIENCCLDLCILTDNLTITKSCESLDNQEIIISESPKFEIERVMDNRKSWVSYTENSTREHDLQFRETQYNIDDYRLSINTKEIDLKIDGANAIEEDVLCIIDCLISGDTGSTVTGACCTEKCDYGYVSDIQEVDKSFSNGKQVTYNDGLYNLGYHIKPPLFKALDTYVTYNGSYSENAAYENYINQGIWVPIYPKVNIHVNWDNNLIDEVEGSNSSCDPEDYASTNRTWKYAVLRTKNQLLLATAPYDWAQFELPNFQIEKYYLNKPCSTTEFRIGEAGPGGIVAYVDETGQHGLIVSLYLSGDTYWHATNSGLVGATNDGLYSGQTNTTLILSTYGSETNVAKIANDYTQTDWEGTIYSDYYLPSKYELNLIVQNWREIGIRLSTRDTIAWSSTENNASTAWAQNFYYGTQEIYNKNTSFAAIKVRQF